jgi:glycosyltransferase involved in cell wall biosynthesis
MRRYRILTWHVHGNYLYYLSHAPHDFHVLSKPGRGPGYSGRIGSLPWGDNVIDCPVAALPGREFDCVLYQSREHYLNDRESVLSVTQRRLPAIYLEHDPPLQHPTNTRHPVADPNVLVVHVTHYNALMWDNAGPTAVIEHGVRVPDALDYSGHVRRGIVIVNHLQRRGRRLGADVFARWRAAQPLDLYGMAAEESGGVGELPYAELMTMMASYRVYCHPVRYTSLALALCEAMSIGLPVIGLATTELPRIVADGVSGFVDSDVDRLIARTGELLRDHGAAKAMGANARRFARERFAIERFAADWDRVFRAVIG